MTESTSFVIRAPAKINLSLEITGRRPDGYHNLVTIFQTIDLSDELSFQPADSLELDCDESTLANEDNLVLRAARILQVVAGTHLGARIGLKKAIPIAAGLGGGSADAAATLLGLKRLWNLSIEHRDMAAIAGQLGADVPFLLRGGTAVAGGIGDEIEWLPDPSPRYVVLLTPKIPAINKTATAFRAIRATDFSDGAISRALADSFRNRLTDRDPWALIETGRNTFDRAAEELYPTVGTARSAMLATGAPWVRLSGAGPTLFTVFDTLDAARLFASNLEELATVRVASTRPGNASV